MPEFQKAPVVILSSIDWNATWQRHQAFAYLWAKDGRRVFFVENLGFRAPRLSDWRRVARRVFSAFRGSLVRRPVTPEGVELVSPWVLPPTNKLFRKLNSRFFAPALGWRLRQRGLEARPIVVCYLPTSTTLDLLDELEPLAAVYDCVDNFHGHPDAPRNLTQTEEALLRRVDAVVTTSPMLTQAQAKRHRRVVEIHQGVEQKFFIDAQGRRPPRKLCYFGTIWEALDFDAIRELAAAGLEIDLIGPLKSAPPLPENVRILPPVAHAELPKRLKRYDGLLLPYRDSEYNKGVVPAKLFECLATGLPVLAARLSGLERYSRVMPLLERPSDWRGAVEGLAEQENEERRARRVELARAHTQDAAFARLRAVLEEALRERGYQLPASSTRRHRSEALAATATLGSLYALAKVCTLGSQVAAGRWLGPEEYGQANLAVAAAAYFQIAPMLGFPTALSKYVASARSEEHQRRIVSTSFLGFFIWAALWLTILTLSARAIARHLGLQQGVFDAALLLAYCTAVFTVSASPLLGLKRFARRGLAEAVYGLLVPVALVFFMSAGVRDYHVLIYAVCCALGAAAVVALGSLVRYLRLSFDRAAFSEVFFYSALAAINLVATACVLAPARLALNVSDSPTSVGIFSAYFTGTAQVALSAGTILASVLIPMASTASGQEWAWSAARRWTPWALCGAAALFSLSGAAGLLLFGEAYPFLPGLVLLFGAAGGMILVHNALGAIFAAKDMKGLMVSVCGSLAAGGINALGTWLWVPDFGLKGAAWALVAGYACGLLVYLIFAPRRGQT